MYKIAKKVGGPAPSSDAYVMYVWFGKAGKTTQHALDFFKMGQNNKEIFVIGFGWLKNPIY